LNFVIKTAVAFIICIVYNIKYNDYWFVTVTPSLSIGGEIINPLLEKAKQELKLKNINLSHQRLKVLEYLTKNRCHPTVDHIFTDLLQDMPTLSKTTVYNTLKMLAETGLVNVIAIEDNETRYDIVTETHGHFKCESCGTIYDFSINIDLLASNDLDDFRIDDKNVYFKGVCKKCLENTI